MGFAFFTLAGLLRPLRRLFGASDARSAAACAGQRRTGMHTAPGRGHIAWPPAPRAQARRPLRVLRVVDAGHAPSSAGRMVISGRMADVCAELDRLVALETAAA